MDAYKHETIYSINTTPQELRKLADKMEKKFPEKTAGSSTCVDIFYSDDAMFMICGDQGRFETRDSDDNKWN